MICLSILNADGESERILCTQHEQADAINLAFFEPLEVYKLTTPLTHLTLEESLEFLEVGKIRVQKIPGQINACILEAYSHSPLSHSSVRCTQERLKCEFEWSMSVMCHSLRNTHSPNNLLNLHS